MDLQNILLTLNTCVRKNKLSVLFNKFKIFQFYYIYIRFAYMKYIGMYFMHWFYYCTGGLAQMTLRFLIISYIVIMARYVEITTIHGTRRIVKKNIILDNIKYVAIIALGKSIVETIFVVF